MGGFNLVDSYINMNFQNIRNLGLPKNEADAVPRRFVDDMVDSLKKTTLEQVQNQFKQINHLVSVSASCYEHLKYDDYPFTFGGPILNRNIFKLDKFNGFLVPADGFIKHFSMFSTGLILNFPPNTISTNTPIDTRFREIEKLYGDLDKPTKIFSLVKVREIGEYGKEEEIIGSVFIVIPASVNNNRYSFGAPSDRFRYMGSPDIEFKPNPKYLNKDKNFIYPVKRGDIINIKSEYTETNIPGDESFINEKGYYKAFPFIFVDLGNNNKNFFLHLATLTFSFKEMSFPDITNLDPL